MTKVMFIAADPKSVYITMAHHEYGNQAFGGQPGMNKAQLVVDDDLLKGRSSIVVWYDGGSDPYFSSFNTAQIYIRGHGMPGSPTIEVARNGEKIHYTEVVQRLITTGLKREFFGDIKCFNCHSGEAGVGVHGNPQPAFAQLIADEMFARGYKFCKFFGYTDAIDSFPASFDKGANPPDPVLHKYRRGPAGLGNLGRAKTGREEFFPNPRPLSLKGQFARKFFN